ncbi:hypothetical protein COLO4_33204 [Corchorus olitorius]|uniref:Rho termination factor-like N-terminal domain-containing protein n=1 Tax=Corchorus olitorius TaxID=93759 RepID=A0A1R3GVU8_9ROSI|nr:hypothetical protein COLO4_33204 [Corchorus olitorius]
MASDLWGPFFPEEASSPGVGAGWQCDFYFGYGFDVIEENAMNEKSCIQVLSILIKKADTEIDELEKDLVLLQSELAWAEHEEWSEICCNALRAKIDGLEISIRKLRNKDENDIEVYLLTHTEPAEKLHEIIKALLKSFCHEKDKQNEQPLDVVVLNSSRGSPEQAADPHKNQNKSASYSYVVAKEEIDGSSVIATENCASSKPSTELEEKKPETQLSNANVNGLILHPLAPAADQFDEKKFITNLDLEATKKQGTKACGRTLNDKRMIQHSSSMFAHKSMHNLDKTKVKLNEKLKAFEPFTGISLLLLCLIYKDSAAQIVNTLDLDASKLSTGHLNKKIKLSASSLKIVSEEATVRTSISEADISILDSSSNTMGKGGDLCKKAKDDQAADIIAKDLVSVASEQTPGHSNEMKKLCEHGLKVNGCKVQEHTGETKLSNSFLNHEHKGNILRSDKPANALVKTISPDTLRLETGLNGKGNNSDSRSGAFGQAESLTSDMEQKLCEFAVKPARKRGIKELKCASTDKKGPTGSVSKAEGKKKGSLQVKQKEAALSNNDHSALTSLIELQDESGKDKNILEMDGKARLEEVEIAEIVARDEEPVMNLYMRPQRGKVKTVETSMEPISARVDEFSLNSKENVSGPSTVRKRLWRYADNHTLNYSLSGKIVQKKVQHRQCEAEEQSMRLDASQNMLSPPKKKCKISSVPIIVEIRGSSFQMNISKLHGDLNASTDKKDFSISEARVDDSGAKGVIPQSFDTSNLKKMKLCDLRAIAKAQKLANYSSLRKEDLVRQLENMLSC